MKIALVSEHASPLAVAGGVDSGGQNIYVANLARQLHRAGHDVDVFTRRDRALLPPVSDMDGVRVVHVPAGSPTQMPKELLLPHMSAFADFLLGFCRREPPRYDVLHANFFMSGLAALKTRESLRVPLVMTFHALGKVRRQHQGAEDGFPDARFAIEEQLVRETDAVIAECPQDAADLRELYGTDPARIGIVPCGFDTAEFSPIAFGITPVEAMGCARPVIGADVGGIRYSVVDGKTGFLVPPRDPDALAKRLARLALDPALGERMGAAGLERALARFTWARVARIIESVYRRVSHVPAENARHQDDNRSRRQAAFQAVRAAAGRM